jgi:hypothetical protein
LLLPRSGPARKDGDDLDERQLTTKKTPNGTASGRSTGVAEERAAMTWRVPARL